MNVAKPCGRIPAFPRCTLFPFVSVWLLPPLFAPWHLSLGPPSTPSFPCALREMTVIILLCFVIQKLDHLGASWAPSCFSLSRTWSESLQVWPGGSSRRALTSLTDVCSTEGMWQTPFYVFISLYLLLFLLMEEIARYRTVGSLQIGLTLKAAARRLLGQAKKLLVPTGSVWPCCFHSLASSRFKSSFNLSLGVKWHFLVTFCSSWCRVNI